VKSWQTVLKHFTGNEKGFEDSKFKRIQMNRRVIILNKCGII